MEAPDHPFSAATAGLLALLLVALLVARMITPLERRLVVSAAFMLAGLFFVGRAAGDAAATMVGVVCWAAGLGSFVRAALNWTSAAASRIGPLAAALLLPVAFFGAVLVEGLVIGLIS